MKTKLFFTKTFIYILLLIGSVITSIPFIYMLSTSFKKHTYVFEVPPKFIPQDPTFNNYIEAWNTNNFQGYFFNSVFVTLVTTVIVLLVSSMLAFAFARFRFFGKEALFTFILLSLMIPSMMLIIPQIYIS